MTKEEMKENNQQENTEESPPEDKADSLSAPVEITPEEIGKLQEKARERDELLDLLQRTRADYLNYQKRVKRDMEAYGEQVLQRFIEDLTPVMDHFEKAIEAAENGTEFKTFLEGIKLIQSQLYKVLADHGIERIETVGKLFNPDYHEAVMQEETAEYPEWTIIEELRQGFTLNGRTIVPARVKVARRPTSEEKQAEEEQQTEEKENEGADDADL